MLATTSIAPGRNKALQYKCLHDLSGLRKPDAIVRNKRCPVGWLFPTLHSCLPVPLKNAPARSRIPFGTLSFSDKVSIGVLSPHDTLVMTTKAPSWSGRSHVATFVHSLHLLDLDLLDDWPEVTVDTFGSKSSLQHRLRCVEWSLYRLYELYDRRSTKDVGLSDTYVNVVY